METSIPMLGLNNLETKVYEYLAKMGQATIVNMCRVLDISRTSAYATLASLQEKSLVTFKDNLSVWIALEFNEYASVLESHINSLRATYENVTEKANALVCQVKLGIKSNRLLLRQFLNKFKGNPIYVFGISTSDTVQLVQNYKIPNMCFVCEEGAAKFGFYKHFLYPTERFFHKTEMLISGHQLVLFLDSMKFSVSIVDKSLIAFIQTHYFNKVMD